MNENVICLMRNQQKTNAIKKRIKLISQFKKYKLKRGQYFTTNRTSRTHTHRSTLRPMQRPHGARL